MKKILLISIALFTTLSMNAQVEKLIYEMDWAGVEYTEGNYFVGETPNASYYKATDEGLAITNPAMNDHIWEVRVINRSSENHGLPLEEGHDYVVRLTLKVPSDGHIFMQLGDLASSWYDEASVTASDDWQMIDFESPSYYCDISDGAHVLLGFGEMVGTTILKKVQVYERTTQDTYRPFVEDGKVWKVGTIPTDQDSPVQIVDYYYFDGDTIIDGKTCKVMMCQHFTSPNYTYYDYLSQPNYLRYVGAWYEEDQKVYFYDEKTQSMRMMYDFSLDANETVSLLGDYLPFIIGPKQTGGLDGFKGVYRDVMICVNENKIANNTIWLEGVGGIEGPTRNAYYIETLADRLPEFLMACVVGDEVIYLNDRYEDEGTPAGARKDRFDFTHTPKKKPKTRVSSEEEPSLYGEYNDQQLDIHLDPLDDTYQVCITDESGKAVYEKAINAGNIVALNIDISTYAKGRYTVTVENSLESFTGEFETLATGIQELKNSKIEELKYIYNLQGQRLSRLQKGLNIVNGRKIYVRN